MKPGTFTAGDVRINRGGRPKLDREVREYIDSHLPRAMRRLWRLCCHSDPYVALGALTLFLKKGIPDLKPAEKLSGAATDSADASTPSADVVTQLASLHKKLAKQVEALDGAEPH